MPRNMLTKIKNSQKNPGGFTLAEILIVIITISVLTTVAIPNLGLMMEKMKATEGEHYLYTILAAQKRYAIDHDNGSGVPQYADNLSDLDIDVSQVLSNFNTPGNGDINTATPVAQITRKINSFTPSYTLHISDQGVITCGCPIVDCSNSICQKLGY